MEKNIKLIVISTGILGLLMGTLIGVGISMIPEGKCARNPLNYGISQLEQGDLRVTCECFFNDGKYQPFFFNDTGVFFISCSIFFFKR